MLISALNDYYDILSKNGKTIPQGYSSVGISYVISLSKDGDLQSIIKYQNEIITTDKKGKTKTTFSPKQEIMPLRSQKTSIDFNVVEHRPLYIFGLEVVGGELQETKKAINSHICFVDGCKDFFDDIHSDLAQAILKFTDKWNPKDETENQLLLDLGKDFAKYFAFCLDSDLSNLLHNDILVKQKWENNFNTTSSNVDTCQCAVCGEQKEIARLHNKVKGIAGGNSTGCVMVGFNNPSECSYGKEQSFNSNISQQVADRYVESLNYLLSDRLHKTTIDDLTIAHFAMSPDDDYDNTFNMFAYDDDLDSDDTDELLKDMINKVGNAGLFEADLNSFENIDPNVDFYVFGLKPNSSRVSIKFLYKSKYGAVLKNIAQHQKDMQISNDVKKIPLWRIKKELISPKSKNDNIDPSLMEKLFKAIFYGYNYPDYLLATVVKRVKTDSDDDKNKFIKINPTRMGIIKACLNRKSRLSNKKEEIKLALDLENKNQAYLCGRLFAVLEDLQQGASNNQLNRTIKDSYFSSAASTPSAVFPHLLKLAQNHIPKANYGQQLNYAMGQIINDLQGDFPKTLSIDEQGKFIIGYYQQKYQKYEKKAEQTESENQQQLEMEE